MPRFIDARVFARAQSIVRRMAAGTPVTQQDRQLAATVNQALLGGARVVNARPAPRRPAPSAKRSAPVQNAAAAEPRYTNAQIQAAIQGAIRRGDFTAEDLRLPIDSPVLQQKLRNALRERG